MQRRTSWGPVAWWAGLERSWGARGTRFCSPVQQRGTLGEQAPVFRKDTAVTDVMRRMMSCMHLPGQNCSS